MLPGCGRLWIVLVSFLMNSVSGPMSLHWPPKDAPLG